MYWPERPVSCQHLVTCCCVHVPRLQRWAAGPQKMAGSLPTRPAPRGPLPQLASWCTRRPPRTRRRWSPRPGTLATCSWRARRTASPWWSWGRSGCTRCWPSWTSTASGSGCRCWVSGGPAPGGGGRGRGGARCSQAPPCAVRNPEGSIYLYTKGADIVIFDLLCHKGLMECNTEEALAVSPCGEGGREGGWRGTVRGEMASGTQGGRRRLSRLRAAQSLPPPPTLVKRS